MTCQCEVYRHSHAKLHTQVFLSPSANIKQITGEISGKLIFRYQFLLLKAPKIGRQEKLRNQKEIYSLDIWFTDIYQKNCIYKVMHNIRNHLDRQFQTILILFICMDNEQSNNLTVMVSCYSQNKQDGGYILEHRTSNVAKQISLLASLLSCKGAITQKNRKDKKRKSGISMYKNMQDTSGLYKQLKKKPKANLYNSFRINPLCKAKIRLCTSTILRIHK